MHLIFSGINSTLTHPERTIPAWSRVRNELNKQRKDDEVVYTEPVRHPFYPRTFPRGKWLVGKPIDHTKLDANGKPIDPYLYPFFIPTDAHQQVSIWELEDGKYARKTGSLYDDKGYGLHFSTSGTTLGCIRIKDKADLFWLVGKIEEAHRKGEEVTLEVVN